MSRLIIKNLPNKVTVDKLKDIFSEKGEVTDVQLKYTKDGKFRNFGFIGFRNEEQASIARHYFDGTCINSMKLSVELCSNLGDEKKPRAWSKYAPDSNAYKQLHQTEIKAQETEAQKEKKKHKSKSNKDKIKELLRKHKDDPLFVEFINAHVNEKNSWIKETLETVGSDDDGENDSDIKEKCTTEPQTTANEKKTEKTANKKISDMEYMKILMKKESLDSESQMEDQPKKSRNRPLFFVKITGLPYKCKKKDIKDFFRPLVPFSIRLPLGKGKKITGFCYVGFRTEQELKKALNKNKLFIGSHRLHIHQYENKAEIAASEEKETLKRKNQEKGHNEESIGESGSIFVRNLPYIISEDELTKLFEKYGPLAEVNMPIDKVLRQSKGFATVTYMIPEHATKAYSELDGSAFCGRMMHLLPARSMDADDVQDDDEGLSFKEKKAKKLKAQAKSSHNWNTLFLGANAVADVVAANYNTTKEKLLTENSKNTSAAVRLALGETQLVAATKTFLEDNGVYLDAFNKPPKKRSKTCILVKNLPANTTIDEIKPLFEKHGQIARFVMPTHCITVLVDYVEPFEAKKAFTKLAYSQFKSSPLYLEWAPENVFRNAAEITRIEPVEKNEREETSVEDPVPITNTQNESTEEKPNGIPNLKSDDIDTIEEPENDTTLFVKNLNFISTDDSLKKHFSPMGKIHSATIAKKKDPKNPGQYLSMGYGFVQYYTKVDANTALRDLQCSTLDGKTLELKRSERGNSNEVKTTKKNSKSTKQNGTKILVRNVPFQANSNELNEIFRAFGEIKSLRLPKKLTPGSNQHRGFAFIDYYSKGDAKSAFEALCQSTHLYGRRLVLEWAEQTDDEDVNVLRKRVAQAYHSSTPGGKKSKKSEVDVDTFVEG